MNGKLPLVSVIMPCYNHGLYVGNAIEAILNQTYSNIELIVADNGCTDNSFEVINRYNDRIKILRLEKNNQRKCRNMLMKAAAGEFIAYATADDEWMPEKIELQMEAFFRIPNLRVCFTWGLYADENMQVLPEQQGNIFLVKNRSREEWFKSFINNGNCLCYPSAVCRNGEFVNFDTKGYVQLADFYEWISAVQLGEIYIVEKPMVKFRWHSDGANQNQSTPSAENMIRTNQEFVEIVLEALETVNDDLFRGAFRDEFINYYAEKHEELLCEKFFLLRHMLNKSYIFSDVMFIFYHKHLKEMEETLQNDYGFFQEDFVELSANNGIAYMDALLYRERQINNAQKDYIFSYMHIAQVLVKEICADSEIGKMANEIFRMLPETERKNLIILYKSCGSLLKIVNENMGIMDNMYYELVKLILEIYHLMESLRDQAKLLGILNDDEEFYLFGQLVQLSTNNKIDLLEALVPYIQIIANQLGDIVTKQF